MADPGEREGRSSTAALTAFVAAVAIVAVTAGLTRSALATLAVSAVGLLIAAGIMAGARRRDPVGTSASAPLEPEPPAATRLGDDEPDVPSTVTRLGDDEVAVPHVLRAQMPRTVAVDEVAVLQLTLGRGSLGVTSGGLSSTATFTADDDVPITVLVLPRRHLLVVGNDRFQFEPLDVEDRPTHRDVLVRGLAAGEGELHILVLVRGAVRGAVTLHPLVVEVPVGDRELLVGVVTPGPHTAGDEDVHQLTVIDQLIGDRRRFDFVFESESLGIRTRCHTELVARDLDVYLRDLYGRLEDAVRLGLTVDEQLRNLRAVGSSMFEQLVPPPLQQVLWDHRHALDGLQLLTDEPLVPWELVHIREPGDRGSERVALAELGMVRWLFDLPTDVSWPPDRLRLARTSAIVPDYPGDWALPEARLELAFLATRLGAATVPSTSRDVVAAIERPGSFDVLHFAGHGFAAEGDPDAHLLLGVSATGTKDTLPSTTVDQIGHLSAGPDHRPVVVLNACQLGRGRRPLVSLGGFARAFLRAGAGVVVAPLWSVGDAPARCFVETLYDELCTGSTVARAALAARERARAAGDLSWLSYVVHAHPHARVVDAPGSRTVGAGATS